MRKRKGRNTHTHLHHLKGTNEEKQCEIDFMNRNIL